MEDLIIGSIPLLIASIISFLIYSKLEPKWLRLIPWFLLLTFLIQFGGFYYSHIFKKSNHFIFNCYILIEFGFYFLLYTLAASRQKIKKTIILLTLLFLICYAVEIFFVGDFFIYNPTARNIGEFLTLISGIIYLSELLMSDEIVNFFKIPMFWVATGIMIANLGDFLYFSFFDYILKNNLDPGGVVYGVITTSLSIIEFSFFTIGFFSTKLWKKVS